jgi:hypothetical protein
MLGAIFNFNKITFHIKALQSVANAILYVSFGAMEIWWYHEYPFKKEYVSYPATMFKTSSVKGNGYGSFFVVAINFLEFI